MTDTTGEHRPTTRMPGLDSVRGIAVVAVVAYHLGYLQGGFIGVDLFFVLSGYLVTGFAINEIGRNGTLRVRAFWGRRMRRLAPALLVMVPIVVAAAIALSWPTVARQALALDAVATLSWWSNWRQVFADGGGYWGESPSLFRHAWSLSIEEQFYLLWPVVLIAAVAVTRRNQHRTRAVIGAVAGLLAVVSGTWAVVLAHRIDPEGLTRIYLGSDTRAVGPLAGCLAAALCWGRAWSDSATNVVKAAGVATAGIIAVAMFTVPVAASSTYTWGVLPAIAVLAAITVVGSSRWRRADVVTGWLGHRSYGIYLWSWPIQVLIEHWRPEISRAIVAAITVALTLALAEVSHRLIEHPVQRHIWWAARPIRRRASAGVALGVFSILVVIAVASATEKPLHERFETSDALDMAMAPPPSIAPPAAPAPGIEVQSDERILLVGDSVAWTIAYYQPSDLPGVETVDSRAVIGCGLLSATAHQWPRQRGGYGPPAGGACEEMDAAIDIGMAGQPTTLMVMPGPWEMTSVLTPDGTVIDAQSPEMAAAIGDRLLELAGRAHEVGARTVLVEWACPGIESTNDRNDPDYVEWLNGVLADTVARSHGYEIEVLHPTAEVCVAGDPSGAATDAKNKAMNNEVHVTDAAGSEWVWTRWLLPGLAQGDR